MASAGTGFLLLCVLGHAVAHPDRAPASLLRLAWCALPLAAAVHLAVAVARTDPGARPRPGLFSAGLGPFRLAAVAAASTAAACALGSALALLSYLLLRGGLPGLPGLPPNGAAAGPSAGTRPLPVPAALTLLALVPAAASTAVALALRPGGRASGRRRPPPQRAPPVPLPPPRRPRAVRPGAGRPALGRRPRGGGPGPGGVRDARRGRRGAAAGRRARRPRPRTGRLGPHRPGPGRGRARPRPPVRAAPAGVPAGYGAAPRGPRPDGRVPPHRPAPRRAVRGRLRGGRGERPVRADGRPAPGPLSGLGAALVLVCAVAALSAAAVESRQHRAGTTAVLRRLGAPTGLLRSAALLRAAVLVAGFAPLAWLTAALTALPLRP